MFTNKMATLLPNMLLFNLHCGMVVFFFPSLVLSFYAFSYLLGILSTFCLLAFCFPISLCLLQAGHFGHCLVLFMVTSDKRKQQ